MDYFKDPLLIRQIIMQHFEEPDHKVVNFQDSSFISKRNKSATCIDDITVHIKLENNIIVDAKFSGEGCTISSAAIDLILKMIINQPVTKALILIDEYVKMIHHQPYDEQLIQELNVFANIYKQPNRKACALNGVDSVKHVLLGLTRGQE